MAGCKTVINTPLSTIQPVGYILAHPEFDQKMGYLVAPSFSTGAECMAQIVKKRIGIEIKLVTLEQLNLLQ